MGGIYSRCCCRPDNRKYLRTRYNVEREMSVEFDTLIDDEPDQLDSHQYGAVMTDQERKMLSERRFHDIVQYQRQVDAEIEKELRDHEERLRMEEEAFYEAKRQAARVARRMKSQELAAKQAAAKKSVDQNWLGKDTDDYEISGEDFQQFLENVRKRSLNTPPRTVPCEVHITSSETRSVNLVTPQDMKTMTETNNSKTNISVVKAEINAPRDTPQSMENESTKDVDDWAGDFVHADVTVSKAKDSIQ